MGRRSTPFSMWIPDWAKVHGGHPPPPHPTTSPPPPTQGKIHKTRSQGACCRTENRDAAIWTPFWDWGGLVPYPSLSGCEEYCPPIGYLEEININFSLYKGGCTYSERTEREITDENYTIRLENQLTLLYLGIFRRILNPSLMLKSLEVIYAAHSIGLF